MFLEAGRDIFGNPENFTSNDFRQILDLIDGYMKDKPYTIREISRDNVNDPNGRVDVRIQFFNEKNYPVHQKLLILKGELIDGITFHKRYDEWYREG